MQRFHIISILEVFPVAAGNTVLHPTITINNVCRLAHVVFRIIFCRDKGQRLDLAIY